MSNGTDDPWEDDVLRALTLLIAEVRGLREDMRGQRTAAPAGSGGNRAAGGTGSGVVKFGRDKGKRLSECADLTWYRNAIAENIDDPSRAQYRQQNLAHLAEIDAAMGRGGGQGPAQTSAPEFGPGDDDIPF